MTSQLFEATCGVSEDLKYDRKRTKRLCYGFNMFRVSPPQISGIVHGKNDNYKHERYEVKLYVSKGRIDNMSKSYFIILFLVI